MKTSQMGKSSEGDVVTQDLMEWKSTGQRLETREKQSPSFRRGSK